MGKISAVILVAAAGLSGCGAGAYEREYRLGYQRMQLTMNELEEYRRGQDSESAWRDPLMGGALRAVMQALLDAERREKKHRQ